MLLNNLIFIFLKNLFDLNTFNFYFVLSLNFKECVLYIPSFYLILILGHNKNKNKTVKAFKFFHLILSFHHF